MLNLVWFFSLLFFFSEEEWKRLEVGRASHSSGSMKQEVASSCHPCVSHGSFCWHHLVEMVSPVHLRLAGCLNRQCGREEPLRSCLLTKSIKEWSLWMPLVLLRAGSEVYLHDLQGYEALDLGLISSVLLVVEFTTDITEHARTAHQVAWWDTPPLTWFEGKFQSQPAFSRRD